DPLREYLQRDELRDLGPMVRRRPRHTIDWSHRDGHQHAYGDEHADNHRHADSHEHADDYANPDADHGDPDANAIAHSHADADSDTDENADSNIDAGGGWFNTNEDAFTNRHAVVVTLVALLVGE